MEKLKSMFYPLAIVTVLSAFLSLLIPVSSFADTIRIPCCGKNKFKVKGVPGVAQTVTLKVCP